jgi:hypothetical protein
VRGRRDISAPSQVKRKWVSLTWTVTIFPGKVAPMPWVPIALSHSLTWSLSVGQGPSSQTSRYGTAEARAWHRMHPRLKARGAWEGPPEETAGHRGHPHPADRRAPAARSRPQAGLAVDLPP